MKIMMTRALAVVAVVMLATAFAAVSADEPECGRQANYKVCPNCFCCSYEGYCGNTSAWCGEGCQSQCHGCDNGVADMISEAQFEQMLQHRNNHICPGKDFYTYEAFIAAANTFPGFGDGGRDNATRKREIAAFLAQTSHETMLGWEPAAGNVTWAGYCLKEQAVEPRNDCCVNSTANPCHAGKQYYGRGPFNITWNDNYGAAGKAIGEDLLAHPEQVATVPIISFQTAIWFWMTPRSPKPSCHDVMTGGWKPSKHDIELGRLPGYGVTTNIINGEVECDHCPGSNGRTETRIAFYKRYCDILGVTYGQNIDCYHQKPFNTSSIISTKTVNHARAHGQAAESY